MKKLINNNEKLNPWVFLILIWLLSLPFWIASYYVKTTNLPDNLPLTDIFAALTPTVSACVIIFSKSGWTGIKTLFKRIFDFNRVDKIKVYLICVLLFPILYIMTYFGQIMFGFSSEKLNFTITRISIVFVMFFIASIAEELGYGAYATEEFQKQYSPLKTSLIIGIPWALWHLNSMIQIGQSQQLIFWGLLGTVAVRIIYVWLFNISNKSVFILILCHTIANTTRSFYPGSRSAYERGNGAIAYSLIIAFSIFIVIKTRRRLGKH